MTNKNDKISQISIDFIDDPKSPIRTRANEGVINDLADSIRDVGLIQPLLVRPRGDRYEVVAGHRRLIACRAAGLLTVPCIVSDVDDAGCDILRLHENLGREDVNIVDQARFLDRLMKQNEWTVSQTAEKIGRSETFIRERLAIIDWPIEMWEALDNQKLSFGAAKWLAKIEDDSHRRHYLDAAIKSGITSRLAYDWYCAWKRKKMPEPPQIEEKKGPTGEPEIQYYFSRCKFCGEKIAMGDEEVIYAHRRCVEEIERGLRSPAERQGGE